MKDFVKYLLATLCGFFIAGLCLFVGGILSLACVMSAEPSAPSIQPHSALRLTLNGELLEDTPDDPLGELLGSNYPTLSQKSILSAAKAQDKAELSAVSGVDEVRVVGLGPDGDGTAHLAASVGQRLAHTDLRDNCGQPLGSNKAPDPTSDGFYHELTELTSRHLLIDKTDFLTSYLSGESRCDLIARPLGMGKTVVPCVMNLFSIWAVRLTLAAWLAPTMGLKGVWLAMCIELCFRGVIFLLRLGWVFRKKPSAV